MYSRILIPVDGSPTSRLALDEAAKLTSQTQTTIILLHVVENLKHCSGFESPDAYIHDARPRFMSSCELLLDGIKGELKNRCDHVETVMVENRCETVAEVIVGQAGLLHVDLIILGTHGRRGINRLMLGSDAEQVARTAPVPVLLVRDTAFLAPAEINPRQSMKKPTSEPSGTKEAGL